MYLLRRTALRALSTKSTTSGISSSRTFITVRPFLISPKQQWSSSLLHRRFASDDAKPSEATTTDETVPEELSEPEQETIEESQTSIRESTDAANQPETAAHAFSETTDAAEHSSSSPSSPLQSAEQTASDLARSATETAQEAGESIAEHAQQAQQSTLETAQQLGQAAGAAVGSAAGATQSSDSYNQTPYNPAASGLRREPAAGSTSAPVPSKILYVGNIYFEVREDTLRREFSRFGNIVNCRVVYDNRGLSKGFSYVEYDNVDSAEAAIRALDQQVLEGRRMTVQYHVPREARRPFSSMRSPHPPSKTLFIGNLSYEMTDKDLNDLFREIRNVLDVRVAIDRRSGQPRGFAHADFVDVPSAQRAMDLLANKEIYGRRLRVDYSVESSGMAARRAPEAPQT